MPEDVAESWKEVIKPRLDQDLKHIIASFSTGADHILSNTQFYMAGMKHRVSLLVEPTIIITCGNKRCKRKVEESITKLKLYYLQDFNRPITVRYLRPPSYWAAGQENHEGPASSSFGISNLEGLWIEKSAAESKCGLRIRFDVQSNEATKHCYAKLSGLLSVNGTICGLTTAHTFLVGFNDKATVTVPEDVDQVEDLISDPDSDSTESSDFCTLASGSKISRVEFSPLWLSYLLSVLGYSFLGQVKNFDGPITSKPSSMDWALIRMLDTSDLEYGTHSLSTYKDLLDTTVSIRRVASEQQLLPGNVLVLSDAAKCSKGFLTQTSVSFQSGGTVMDVREVLLDDPLPSGASGSWIVRDETLFGYVVAITGMGLSCFMIPMERVFYDIEGVSGCSINLAHVSRDSAPLRRSKHATPVSSQGMQPKSAFCERSVESKVAEADGEPLQPKSIVEDNLRGTSTLFAMEASDRISKIAEDRAQTFAEVRSYSRQTSSGLENLHADDIKFEPLLTRTAEPESSIRKQSKKQDIEQGLLGATLSASGTVDADYIYKNKNPECQATTITNVSASFDDTLAWDRKTVLSLGRVLANPVELLLTFPDG